MYRLSSIIVLLTLTVGLFGQSPHGTNLTMDCIACHTSESWEIPIEWWETAEGYNTNTSTLSDSSLSENNTRFNHNDTDFELDGSHAIIDCRACHASLIFEEATTSCLSCHIDIHSQSLGNDCVRCHNTDNWLVDNIPELHEENGFPLVGAHDILSCVDCHISETSLRFDRIGNECVTCHITDYDNTESPNHAEVGFSMDCLECHPPLSETWETDKIVHSFFPLVGGHDIQDCTQCHFTDNYSDASPECVLCHQEAFNNTIDPNHIELGFSTDCASCHTIDPDWQPARFTMHDDAYFPIYSGEHNGEWNECVDCHTTPGDFTTFSCTVCHTNPGTDNEHNGVSGYVYESNACFACHPTGSEEGSFNHDNTNFPLRGAHANTDCLQCHADGFAGTSTDCFACHEMDYNNTNNPNHLAAQFPTDCAQCHNESAWDPATFDHDNMYFPIYSGNHNNEWNSCIECHTNANDYSVFSCIDCHEHNNESELANDHDEVNDYAYISSRCYECHPTGE